MKRLVPLVSGLAGVAIGWFLHTHYSSYPSPQSDPELRTDGKTSSAISTTETNRLDTQPVVSVPAHNVLPETREALLSRALEAKNFERAISIYTQQFDSATAPESNTGRSSILSTIKGLYSNKQYSEARQLLHLYLATDYRDVDALLIKADVLAAMRDTRRQIETLYDARAYAYKERVIQDIERRIRDTVTTHGQYLEVNNLHAQLLDLYQALTYREPDYSPYFIELAKAQLRNQLDYEAGQSLELVKYDPLVGAQARELLARLYRDDEGASNDTIENSIAHINDTQSIPLFRQGNHFVVKARLNNRGYLKLMIDTGASLTIIKPESLYSLIGADVDEAPLHTFNTANGIVRAPVLQVDSLAIGEFEVTNINIGGLGLENMPNADGLLGMNFLQHFRFFIDQKTNSLRLSLSQ